jgi:hypothetical protein
MKKISILSTISIFLASKVQAQGIVIPEDTGLPNPDSGIIGILINFLSWLLVVFLILSLLAFVITGIMYLVALGDSRSQTLENAKQYFKYAIIAVVVVGSSYIIIRFINTLLNAELFF